MSIPSHIRPLDELDAAWRVGPAGVRLEAVRRAARKLRARLHEGATVTSVRTYDLVTLPYPTRYALADAARSPLPFIMMTNRMQLINVATDEGMKRVVVNPSDQVRNAETPFFKRLLEKYGDFLSHKVMSKRHAEVPERMREAGVDGAAVDYVTFDHLHTQDLRRVLGEWFPKAKLLVMKEELAIFEKLHPLQTDWYLPNALEGVPQERIVAVDRDVIVGDGLVLVRTPGHTLGNHSIVVHTDRGVWAISENGIAADSYVPEKSELGGLAGYARARGVEVILNSNTREASLEQYTSMVLEKELVDPCPDGSGFLQHFPSSELTASALLPGLAPTYAHKAITQGPAPR
jgi:glyoxylase-like metal-dependent hydrolase (beta-lactamase superfamily II)